MEKDSNSFLRDVSTIIATLLPALQLLFAYLPKQITSIFLSPKTFTAISIITLFLSYIAIIIVQGKPFATITLPFQNDRKIKYDEYLRKISEASGAKTFVVGEQAAVSKIDNFLKKQNINPAKRPLQIRPDNVISNCVSVLIVSTLLFVVLGQLKYTEFWAILQSISYVLLVVSAVLILTFYRINSLNNKRFLNLQKKRTGLAIDLAVINNCFIPIPQVKFITCFEEAGFGNYHVWVEYDSKKYEIITDNPANKLVSFTEINI